jgi:DNA-binding GntR family transcriptional regulator
MSSVNSTRVFKAMEAEILSGRLKPRERLVEMDLIARFGVSRTVIREAIKMLEAKGLVRTTPYRGAVVADLTVEEIEEIYFVRGHLERIAARLVLVHVTARDIRHLKSLAREVEQHLRKKTDRMIEMDSQFHRALFSIGRNRYLCELIDFLRTQAHVVRFNAWSLPDRIEQSIFEHRQIIQAIEERDLRRLQKLVVRHLMVSKNRYLSQLKGLKERKE